MDETTLIHKLLDIFQYKSSYQLTTSNIQPQDMYVLERIYFNKKLQAKELSNKYNIPPSTLTGIVDRLERNELIQRTRTNKDRRAVELSVTIEGNSKVERHIAEDKLFAKNFFQVLDTEKEEKLKELLEELLHSIVKETLFSQENN